MENGVYAARPKAASVYESEKGALVLALVHQLDGGGEIKSYHALTTRDGAINTRGVEDLKKWSGWDGCDPYWFMDTDLSGTAVELVVENEPGFNDPSKLFPKVKWVNPPGGGAGGGLRDPSDRKSVLAKYGSKFRAVAGPQPATRRQAAPGGERPPTRYTAPTLPPQVPAAAPVRKAAATQSSAWARLNELGAGMGRSELEALWFACVDSTGMDQADMTPEGWAKVTEAVEAHFGGNGAGTLNARRSTSNAERGEAAGEDEGDPTPF